MNYLIRYLLYGKIMETVDVNMKEERKLEL